MKSKGTHSEAPRSGISPDLPRIVKAGHTDIPRSTELMIDVLNGGEGTGKPRHH